LIGDTAEESTPSIIDPPKEQEIAIVVRKKIPSTSNDNVSKNLNKKGTTNANSINNGLTKFQKKKK
jgi:hypothetical protein